MQLFIGIVLVGVLLRTMLVMASEQLEFSVKVQSIVNDAGIFMGRVFQLNMEQIQMID